MTDLFFSFGAQHPGALVLHNYPRFMQELSIPGNPVFDMGAVDIMRARERGVPRYNEFRRQLGLTPIRSFGDLTDDADVVRSDHRGLRRRRRGPRPAGRHPRRGSPSDRVRLRRDDVPDLHPQRDPPAPGRPLLHRRLPRRGVQRRGSGLDRPDDVQGRHPPPSPRARRHRSRQREERVRAVGCRPSARSGSPPAPSVRPRAQEGSRGRGDAAP